MTLDLVGFCCLAMCLAYRGALSELRVGITLVNSVELALKFFQHGFDFNIVFIKPDLVVPGSWSKHLEGSRMNHCLQRVPVISGNVIQLAFKSFC